MKSILSILVSALLFSNISQAVVMTLNCTTEKGTELNLTYDNYPAQLISLKIAGKDLSSQLSGRFGTTDGRPNFTLSDFPQAGLNTHFNVYATGTYTVMKAGSFSGQDYAIKCTVIAPEAKKVDNSF